MDSQTQPALSGRFAVRLAATLVLTMAAVGVAQYELVGRALTSRVLAHDLDGHRADVEVLKTLHRPGTTDPLSEVQALLGHMAARPGLSSVALLGPDATVIARGVRHSPGRSMPGDATGGGTHAPAATDHEMPDMAVGNMPVGTMPADPAAPGGMAMPEPAPLPATDERVAEQVLAGGDGVARHLARSGQVIHGVPVELSGERHVLLIGRSDAPLVEQVASVRRMLLLALVLGTVLALPLFFLVGGRELAARHRRAVEASTRDGLTGLGNHRYFHERLATTVAENAHNARQLCLALVDLDGFKQVNDGSGHRRGDEVLAIVARTLLTAAPGSAYRVGGDEFALLLAGDLDEATAVAERVRAHVAALGLGVTTSIGIAPLVPGSAVQPLWDAADAALYAAKHSGRNRVVVDGSAAALCNA